MLAYYLWVLCQFERTLCPIRGKSLGVYETTAIAGCVYQDKLQKIKDAKWTEYLQTPMASADLIWKLMEAGYFESDTGQLHRFVCNLCFPGSLTGTVDHKDPSKKRNNFEANLRDAS